MKIDLSLFNTPGGKEKLAETLISALREKGFFYVKGFGISQERVDRQFALGKNFYELPLEERLKYQPSGLGTLILQLEFRAVFLMRCSQTRASLMDTFPPVVECLFVVSDSCSVPYAKILQH